MLKPIWTTHHCEVTADVLDEDEILRNLRPTAPRRLHRSIFALTWVKLGADLETQVGQVQLREDSGELEVANGFALNSKTFLGPRGPLVLPSVGSFVPSRKKNLDHYIQAYMPYES